MRILFLFAASLLFACKNKTIGSLNLESFIVHSVNTGDDYTVQIRKPAFINSIDSFNLIYAVDGSIGLGDYLLGKDSNWSAKLPSDCIVITIGHIGDWHEKRRRDFIPSDISKDSTESFGQANQFFLFLKNELLPIIAKRNINTKNKFFVGHSFGGLFCLYAALQNDTLFDRYFAISPSVWANYYELLKIEKRYAEANHNLSATISIYTGSLEVFNKVLSSSKEFYNSLQLRSHKNLQLSFSIITNANHFSVRKPAIDKILMSIEGK